MHTRICTNSTATLSSTTRTVSSLAPLTAMQRSRTATDLGALAQAAGAAILTAPADKRRSSMQHPCAKRNNSRSIPRPTVISTTSHPILVVDRRATGLASLARTTRAQVMGPSGAHHQSAMRRTVARPSAHFIQEHGFTSKPATPPLNSSLKDSKGGKVKFVKSQQLVGKVDQNTQASTSR